jgi:hypothetical protein
MTIDLKTLVTSLYDLLEPADPADRKKGIRAVLTMLGDDTAVSDQKGKTSVQDDADDDEDSTLNAKARSWMKRNEVTVEQLAHVFHIENETVDIIADHVLGKNQKEQAINAYLLTGVAEYLKSGEAKFTDKAGRAACQKLGCYGDTNHSTYMKKPGNILSGSKESGWALTAPGLKAGAELVKRLTAE